MSIIIRIMISSVLLWACYAKIGLPLEGPTIYQHWTAIHPMLRFVLPACEAILAIWVLSGIRIRVSSMLVVLMISAFSGLLIAELLKEHPKPCGCMGVLATAYEPAVIRRDLMLGLGRNAVLILGACYFFVVAGAKPISVLNLLASPPITGMID